MHREIAATFAGLSSIERYAEVIVSSSSASLAQWLKGSENSVVTMLRLRRITIEVKGGVLLRRPATEWSKLH